MNENRKKILTLFKIQNPLVDGLIKPSRSIFSSDIRDLIVLRIKDIIPGIYEKTIILIQPSGSAAAARRLFSVKAGECEQWRKTPGENACKRGGGSNTLLSLLLKVQNRELCSKSGSLRRLKV